jgi:CRP/FNR family cyclic AMP-dependent transcriptional regulator
MLSEDNRRPKADIDRYNDQSPRVARLAPELFGMLFKDCKAERYQAGEHLFLQEDLPDRLYGVVTGTIEISIYSASGRKLVANIELSQSLIGEIGVLDGLPRTATATCLSDCELVSISRNQLFDRIEKTPSLARAMIELLCARLRWVSGELGDHALLKIEARLAKRLNFLSGHMGDAGGWILISQTELAEFLGATRESVNKILNDWRSRSLIEMKRGGIRVAQKQALQDIADFEDD